MNSAISHGAFHLRPIHVLYLVDQLRETGGAERMLLNTVRLLPRDRFRCSVVTFKIDSKLALFKDFPCSLYLYPLQRTYDWNALRVALKLRRLIRSQDVAIVHTFFETADLWGGFVAKLSDHLALISNRRDMGIMRSGKHHVGYRLMNRYYDLVLAVSDEVRTFCIEHDHVAPNRVVTLRNGLDLEKIQVSNGADELRNSLALAGASHLIVTVGHIRKVKGLDVFVRAAAQVCREFPRAFFLVVGGITEPQCYQELQELVVKLNLQHNVRFLGDLENVFPLLQICDVFCLLSRSEGFSNALIEAMACRLPCVATRVGGNGEALEDRHSGFLVANEDAHGAAESIMTLLRDPIQAKKMGQAGQRIVARKFTSRAMIDELVRLYESVLAARGN